MSSARGRREDGRTAAAAAKLLGVGRTAVNAWRRIDKEAPDLAARVAAGDLPLERAGRITRDRAAASKRAAISPPAGDVTVEVRQGDVRDATLLDDIASGTISIVTDPPWHVEFANQLAVPFAQLCARLMPAVVAVMVGPVALNRWLVAMEQCSGMPYRWVLAVTSRGGGSTNIFGRGGVNSCTKLVLVDGHGGRITTDHIVPTDADSGGKEHHEWGQSVDVFSRIISVLVPANGMVVDPFCGGGTTLEAAVAERRSAIGVEVDPEHVAACRTRLGIS